MMKEPVATLLVSYLTIEDRKTFSICCSYFRKTFWARPIMSAYNLLVYSSDQLNQLSTHTDFLNNVVHLLVLVTNKSISPAEQRRISATSAASAQPNQAAANDTIEFQVMLLRNAMNLVELFVVDAIVHMTSVARLVSISVASCNATITSLLHKNVPSQAQLDQCKTRLDSITADKLQTLKYVNVQPVNKVLSLVWHTLLDRAAAIDTLEFRNKTPWWLHDNTNSSACLAIGKEELIFLSEKEGARRREMAVRSSPETIQAIIDLLEFQSKSPLYGYANRSVSLAIGTDELDFIGVRCGSLRKLLGVRVDEVTLQKIIAFEKSGIKLSDVYLGHTGVSSDSLLAFLVSQSKLVKVHIEKVSGKYSNVAPLYDYAALSMPDIKKFEIKLSDDDQRAVTYTGGKKKKIYSYWESSYYSTLSTIPFEQVSLLRCEMGRWGNHPRLPVFVASNLRSLTIRFHSLGDALLETVAQNCTGLRTVKLSNCIFSSNSSLILLSNMANLRKLVLIETTFLNDIQGFSMPQLRELVVQTDFAYSKKRGVREILQNVGNVTHLTLLDTTTEPDRRKLKFKDAADGSKLPNLRWLVTNMHADAHRRKKLIRFSVHCFPFLERLTLIQRDCDTAEAGVDLELVNNRNEAVSISSNPMKLHSYLFISRTATYRSLFAAPRRRTTDEFVPPLDEFFGESLPEN